MYVYIRKVLVITFSLHFARHSYVPTRGYFSYISSKLECSFTLIVTLVYTVVYAIFALCNLDIFAGSLMCSPSEKSVL